jgi:hypothetical protein
MHDNDLPDGSIGGLASCHRRLRLEVGGLKVGDKMMPRLWGGEEASAQAIEGIAVRNVNQMPPALEGRQSREVPFTLPGFEEEAQSNQWGQVLNYHFFILPLVRTNKKAPTEARE